MNDDDRDGEADQTTGDGAVDTSQQGGGDGGVRDLNGQPTPPEPDDLVNGVRDLNGQPTPPTPDDLLAGGVRSVADQIRIDAGPVAGIDDAMRGIESGDQVGFLRTSAVRSDPDDDDDGPFGSSVLASVFGATSDDSDDGGSFASSVEGVLASAGITVDREGSSGGGIAAVLDGIVGGEDSGLASFGKRADAVLNPRPPHVYANPEVVVPVVSAPLMDSPDPDIAAAMVAGPPPTIDGIGSVSMPDLERTFTVDSDGDGVTDWEEANQWVVDAGQANASALGDSDGDGVSDLEEAMLGTDPLSAPPSPSAPLPGLVAPTPLVATDAAMFDPPPGAAVPAEPAAPVAAAAEPAAAPAVPTPVSTSIPTNEPDPATGSSTTPAPATGDSTSSGAVTATEPLPAPGATSGGGGAAGDLPATGDSTSGGAWTPDVATTDAATATTGAAMPEIEMETPSEWDDGWSTGSGDGSSSDALHDYSVTEVAGDLAGDSDGDGSIDW